MDRAFAMDKILNKNGRSMIFLNKDKERFFNTVVVQLSD